MDTAPICDAKIIVKLIAKKGGHMAESRVTYTLINNRTDKLFTVQGTSDTITEARAEAQAKIALIDGDCEVLGGSESSALDSSGVTAVQALLTSGAGGADANLTLRKGTDRSTTRTVPLPNMSGDYKDATAQDGSIDVGDATVQAFGTAYRDSTGNGGYSVIKGAFRD